jgi:hypothetical protein
MKQYAKAEERQASHILIAVKPDAKDDEKAAAKKKAEDLAAQARRAPAKFAELAKENSQDPGSATQGDLGFIARDGSMVKAIPRTRVFSGKEGDIIGPVQTDFGWHVIRVTAVEAGEDAELRGSQGPDRAGPEAATGDAELRRCRQSVREPGLRAGGIAAAGRQGAQPEGADHRLVDARAVAAAGPEQSQIRAGGIQPGLAAGEAEHRCHRGRAEHDDGGARDRL